MLQWTVLTIIATGFFLVLHTADSCNEAVCGSIVSKCLLTQSCKCDLKNCTCCRECYSCLSVRYNECCSCVDMCPKPNDNVSNLGKQSYVEDFSEKVPALFHALTEQPDPQDRWISYTYPIEFDITQFAPKKEVKLHLQSAEQESTPSKPDMAINCTVAFMYPCMSWTKCRSNCQSMGSSSFRWFHNGCCECVGDTCINYGMSEAKCLNCSDLQDLDDIEEYNMWGYDDQSLEDFDEDVSDDSTTN